MAKKKAKKEARNGLFRSEMFREYYEMHSYSACAELSKKRVAIDQKRANALLAAQEAEAQMTLALALQKKAEAAKIIADNTTAGAIEVEQG